MHKSLLIEQLSKFSPKEVKEFGEYVNSPFFNKNQSVIKLYEYVRKLYPVFPEKKMEKLTVFGSIFPNADYNDGFMRTVIFNLSRLADGFLAFKRYKNDYFVEKRYLLYDLNEKGLDRQIEKTMRELTKAFSKVQVHEADYYLNKFKIEYEYFYYLNRLNQDKIEKFINNSDVENIFNHLTYFYLLQVIKYYAYYLNAVEILKINFDKKNIEDIIMSLKPDIFADVPELDLYYNVIMLHLREDDKSYFYKVKEQAARLEKTISKYEVMDTYVNLENYCKKMIRKGHTSFNNELFIILKIEIEKELYGLQGKMSDKFYRNTTETALKLGEFKWAKEFMKNYKCKLPSDSTENTFYYSSALYEFAAKNFSKSMEYLSKVKYDDVYQKAELRCLTAQLYYELEMEDSLYAHLDSFRHFLANDKLLPGDRKKYFINFVRFLKSLARLREGKISFEHLNNQVKKAEKLHNKEWLSVKLGELESQYA